MRKLRGERNETRNLPLSDQLEENIDVLKRLLTEAPDVTYRHFQLKTGEHGVLVFIEGLVDKMSLNDHILRPLLYEVNSIQDLLSGRIPIGTVELKYKWADIDDLLFDGTTLIFIDQHPLALIVNTQGWPQRAIKEPQTESSIKGGHQGFIETGDKNIAMIRRYLPNRELKIRRYTVGRRGKTKVFMLYIEDITQPDFIKVIEDRLDLINVDVILNTGELEGFLEDRPYSLFPQFLLSERPDAVAGQLLQGRVALVVDHSPSVLIGPANFASFFQNIDDYSSRWVVATFLRLLRLLALIVASSLPAFYIAVLTFHYEVIPVDLLISIGESRARVPFPPILEALLMEIAIEMLREAGLRVPSPIGQTTGVVGGIIIGQAAVQAGIVSNIMVIVVAITAISSFIIPNQDMAVAIRLVRFPMMIIASMFGMVGISIGLMIFAAHLISLETLRVPYGSPIAPIRVPDWKDLLVRVPLWKMVKRPLSTNPKQLNRLEGRNSEEEK